MLNIYFKLNGIEYNKNQFKIPYSVDQYLEKIQVEGSFAIKINDDLGCKEIIPKKYQNLYIGGNRPQAFIGMLNRNIEQSFLPRIEGELGLSH